MKGSEMQLQLQLPIESSSRMWHTFKTPLCDPYAGRPEQQLIIQQGIIDDLLARINSLQTGSPAFIYFSHIHLPFNRHLCWLIDTQN
jgi:hypothetical protein